MPLNRRVWALLALGFILRTAYAFCLPNALLLPDADSFDTIAWTLASTGHFATVQGPTAARPPAYIAFLALIYRCFGHHWLAGRLVQGLLGTLLVWIVMRLAVRFSDLESTRWVAGTLAAIYPFFIYYDNQLISESFMTFWLAVAVLLFWRWQEDPLSWTKASGCGVALSILSLSKTIFLPLTCLWLFVNGLGAVDAAREKSRWLRTGVAAVILILPSLLWGMRNDKLFGRFLIDSHGGYTVLGTIKYYEQVKEGIYGDFIKTQPVWINAQNLNEAKQDAFFMDQAKAFIREHPARYMRQSLGNFKNLWRFYPRQDVHFKEGSRHLTLVSLLTEPGLILLGLVGIYRTRNRWKQLYPVYTSILFLTLVYTLITGQMRYRLPLMPFFILFSSTVLASALARPCHDG